MQYLLRRAVESDQQQLVQLFAQVDRLHRETLPNLFQPSSSLDYPADFFTDLLQNAAAAIFVAEVNGELAGFVIVVERKTPLVPILVPRRFALIDTLCVREDLRRCGIGQALMAEAEDWARERGISAVELNVYEFNATALHFYENLGYSGISRRMGKTL